MGLSELRWIDLAVMWSEPPLNGEAEAQRGQGEPRWAELKLSSPALEPRPAHTPIKPLKTASVLLQWPGLPTRSQAPRSSPCRCSCFPGTSIPDSAGVS